MARFTSSSLTKSTGLFPLAAVEEGLTVSDDEDDRPPLTGPPRFSVWRPLWLGPVYMLPASASTGRDDSCGRSAVCRGVAAGVSSGWRVARNLSTIAAISARLILPAPEPATA